MRPIRYVLISAAAATLLGIGAPAHADRYSFTIASPGGIYFDYSAGYGHYGHYKPRPRYYRYYGPPPWHWRNRYYGYYEPWPAYPGRHDYRHHQPRRWQHDGRHSHWHGHDHGRWH